MAQGKLYRNFIILQEDERGHSISKDKPLSGYAKIEAKGEKCKIVFYAQNLKSEYKDCEMVLICNKKDGRYNLNLGPININSQGKAEMSIEDDVNNIGNSNVGYDKIIGASLCKEMGGKMVFFMCGFLNGEEPKDNWKTYKMIKAKKLGNKLFNKSNKDNKDNKDSVKYEISNNQDENRNKSKVNKDNCDNKDNKDNKENYNKNEHKHHDNSSYDNKMNNNANYENIENNKKYDNNNFSSNKYNDYDKYCEEIDKEDKKHSNDKYYDNENNCNMKNNNNSWSNYNVENNDNNCNMKNNENNNNWNNDENNKFYYKDDRYGEYERGLENKYDDYEKEISRSILTNERMIDENDFELNGSMAEFFNGVLDDFTQVRHFTNEIKNCKWYKVNVDNFDNMCNMSNYNKYTVAYYPMMNYYPYISKYGYFMIGLKCDNNGKVKYIVYGIPGGKEKQEQPYNGKTGFVTWCPEDPNSDYGHWLMFYDFENSTIAVPVK